MALKEKDLLIDLECGGTTSEEGSKEPCTGVNQTKKLLGAVWDRFVCFDGSIKREDSTGSVNALSSADVCPENPEILTYKKSGEEPLGLGENKTVKEKSKKTRSKRPPKPPRPPRGPSLDAADMKLVREITELAMLKRARLERMKAFKKVKAAKSTSSSSSLVPMLITMLFFLVILFQGLCCKSSSGASFHGSPESAVDLLSVQYKNLSPSDANATSSQSPYFMEQVAGSTPGEEMSRATE